MIINCKYEDPYDKFPPIGSIPFLSQSLVKSKLSKKFWNITKNIFELSFKEVKSDDIKDIKSNNPININNNNDYYFKQINNNNNNNKNEEDEKRIYIEKLKKLKQKNENLGKIISQQEEENKILIKKAEELENILKTKMNVK